MVKNTLKDPDSAQFQNIEGYCGEVNAKNSYGGYIGFKKFYISNDMPIFYDEDADDTLSFSRGWFAHCESESKLSNKERTSCSAYSDFAASVVRAKMVGQGINDVINVVKDNEDSQIYIKTIKDIYSNKNVTNDNEYALTVLNDCLDKKIKVPF